jgi:hypothetical protein
MFSNSLPVSRFLDHAISGKRKVYWQNLREEPLIFINGQPFVVREADQPFSNLEYTGEEFFLHREVLLTLNVQSVIAA